MRRAFTLVEMLVVVIIISMLVGLLAPAMIGARNKANRAVISMEISQLDFACKAFKEKFGEYPPDFADEDRVAALEQVKRFIARAWPRCTKLPRDFRGASLPAKYDAGRALVYWLGGLYDDSEGNWVGFSADPQNPFDVDDAGDLLPPFDPGNPTNPHRSPSRIQSFFKFQTGPRVVGPKYATPIPVTAGYVYFRAENRSYATKGWPTAATLGAMYDGPRGTAPRHWLASESFQIRCCGMDGLLISPALTWWAAWGLHPDVAESRDDLGSCWEGMLEDCVQ
jgi:prepilin-type N-terminal cleavage/methylation domain-containing protein